MCRFVAARLQAHVMGVDLVIVARTDALDAKLIDNNVDPIDQPFILGCTDPHDSSKVATFVDAGKEAILKKYSGLEQESVCFCFEKSFLISSNRDLWNGYPRLLRWVLRKLEL